MLKYRQTAFVLFSFFSIWQLLSSFNGIDAELFPRPTLIFESTISLLMTSGMWLHIFKSLERLLFGFLLGWPLGILVAIVTGFSANWRKSLHPFINFGYALPKVALFPLLLVIFGIGDGSKVVLIASGVFFLIYIAVFNGLILLLSKPVMDVATVYSVRGLRFWYSIIGKGLVLDIITGSKAGFGYGLVLVVVSEAQMTRQGIGYFLWQAWDQFRILEIYDAILIIGFIGLIVGRLFDRLTATLVSRYSLS